MSGQWERGRGEEEGGCGDGSDSCGRRGGGGRLVGGTDGEGRGSGARGMGTCRKTWRYEGGCAGEERGRECGRVQRRHWGGGCVGGTEAEAEMEAETEIEMEEEMSCGWEWYELVWESDGKRGTAGRLSGEWFNLGELRDEPAGHL